MKLKTLLFSLLLSISLSGVSYAGVNKGWEAFDKGDYQTSFKEWETLAKQGDAEAQFLVGKSYDTGKGVVTDSKKAFLWFKKSAEQGHSEAQSSLGIRYALGEGVDEDDEKAVVWLSKAAKQGDAAAQGMLGIAYGRGNGVLKDMSAAKYWTKKAYDNDDASTRKLAKKFWELLELWKYKPYKPKKDGGSFATNKAPKQKEHYSNSGTGFRVDKKGMLITNYHVVKGCSDVKVNGNKVVVKSTDSRNDLALLQGSPSSLIPSIRLGDIVIIAGYPLQSVLGSGLNVTTGTVASLSGLGNNTSRMQITAPINSGNSGGPVFDNSGRIVGVVVSKINTTKAREILGEDIQGANFAIKGSVVRSFLDMNDVDYEVSSSNKNMSTADIAENAKEYTALIKCWK